MNGQWYCRRTPEERTGTKGRMHDVFLPPSLIVSFLLALLALALNYVNPGAAAFVGAVAALIFLKLLVMGR
jgi:hypothetical protein